LRQCPDGLRDTAFDRLDAGDQSCADGAEADEQYSEFSFRGSDVHAFFDHFFLRETY
jgi:hypothetical protein